ncbi:class C sortase [Bifidobacterium longum]|uniref:class C sortase n=1 Tax=Bifidobacterium longum TaxID=216816 RepID=UPI001F5A45C4|nr:class C sortase [Bifidobacterium longum]
MARRRPPAARRADTQRTIRPASHRLRRADRERRGRGPAHTGRQADDRGGQGIQRGPCRKAAVGAWRGRGRLLGGLVQRGRQGVPWAARRGRRGHDGAVRYPRLHISLPVRHGTDAAALERSAGHLYGTSLPVGGESTHAVVAAHRGLADRLMFTNLGLAKKGDLFEIDVQGERLRYKVTDIRVTGPDDVKPLAIEKGRDLVTLYTCTPYGVNTQRLLVTGERTDAPSGGGPGPVERLPDWLVPLVPLWGLLGVSVGRAVRGPRRRRGRHAKR